MAGVSLVGLSGSMIKDAVKEFSTGSFDGLPPPEPVEEPEVTKVLVGGSCFFPAAGFGHHLTTLFRCILHCVCPDLVRVYCMWPTSFIHVLYFPRLFSDSTARCGMSADASRLRTATFVPVVHSTATQFVVEGMSNLLPLPLVTYAFGHR